MDTSMTHLTLKCFMSNSEMNIGAGVAGILLSRLVENQTEEC